MGDCNLGYLEGIRSPSLRVHVYKGPSMRSFEVTRCPIEATVCEGVLQGNSVFSIKDRWVWGASVIRGDDGLYHMLYATWESGEESGVFQNSWVLHSKIGYAVSRYAHKNFEDQGIVLQGRALDGDPSAWDAQTVHNPHIRMFNGRYYLYYTG